MDTSKDMLESARSQRLQDRNLNKELQKTDSISDETANDKYAFVGMPTDSSATKSATSRTVPDSSAPPVFSGTNVDADTWLSYFLCYAEYQQLSDEDIIAIFLRIPAAALRDNYWKHLATYKNFDSNFFELEHYIQSPRFLLFDDSISSS